MATMTIREYRPQDFGNWVRMRCALWPEIALEDADDDAREWLARTDAVVLVAEHGDNAGLAGFVEVGERAYADGCDTAPVAYLEGWYVEPGLRRKNIGRELVEAAVSWARKRGYREMASDALLENVTSHRAHEGSGFEEIERAVRYRRAL